ncbi:MAG: 3-oxoacyl-[acyl-carrier-protein] synthase III C-terminal domain-containing protein [Vicinamibacterales bacterium]|jgi:3-hydroxy-3-methylglutaryl CoA synthase|nr:3-oxoacyl-[acyl-carrier-protein] synthase III C-terminal domain-containing protein [Vicinamibacterales bacterium]
MSVGIHAFGGYVPRLRLQRGVIAEANAWFNPGLKGLGKGERSIANWDEDAVTMAVEASRDALGRGGRDGIRGIYLASTSLPFEDRQNAGIVAEALHLGHSLHTLDIAGSQRAGMSALVTAFQTVAGGGGPILVVASEKRRTKAASPLELTTGDGAAALLVGQGDGAARLLGHATETADFVDHYRGQHQAFDYVWEERWIRDEGYLKLVPAAAVRALEAAAVDPGAIDHFCFPSAARRVAATLASKLGIPDTAVRDNLQGSCGEAGAAHPLLMLVHALEQAGPGDKLLVTGFGQGCDAVVIEAGGQLRAMTPRVGISGHLARRRAEHNYQRYLAINDLVTIERGLRAEVDKQTGLTTLYRNKDMLLGFVGGRCRTCGTLQYPKSNVCANPDCDGVDGQDDHPFSEMTATLNSYTADRLTYCPDPPAYYGMVQFDDGGRAMIDFADIDPGTELQVGQPMRMMFRIKDYDTTRGFRRYFWKATPATHSAGQGAE